MLAALVAATCGTDASSAVATIPALEGVLQRRLDAMRAGDLASFQATVDQTLPAFRRVQRERFDLSATVLAQTGQAKVAKLEPYGTGHVRREAAGWILTQPMLAELGGEKSRTVGDVRVDYWAIDEDVVGLLAREVEDARAFAGRGREDRSRTRSRCGGLPSASFRTGPPG